MAYICLNFKIGILVYFAVLNIFYFLIFLFFASPLLAQNFSLSAETEWGRKSVPEESLAQEDDLSISRHSLHFGVKAEKRFKLEAQSTYWEKDYRSFNEFDNVTRIYGISPTVRILRGARLRIRMIRREKRYPNQPSINFNQATLQPTFLWEKKDYSVALGFGWRDTHYIAAQKLDQTNYYQETHLKKTLMEGDLDLKASYRMDWNEFERAGKERVKQELESAIVNRMERPWIKKWEFSGSFGKRDSKDVDGREEDIDFSFWDYRLRTQHDLIANLLGKLQYAAFENDFLTNRFDSNGWEAGADFDYLWRESDAGNVRFDFQSKFKKVNYSADNDNSYRKVTARIGTARLLKKDWKADLHYEMNLYRFNLSSQDKIRHIFSTEGGRWFYGGKFYLSLSLDYRYTDRFQEADDRSATAAVSFRTQF